MEALLAIFVILIVVLVFVLPIVSIVIATRLKNRVTQLEAENHDHEEKLRWLYERLQKLESGAGPVRGAEPVTAEAAAPQPAAGDGAGVDTSDAAPTDSASAPDANVAAPQPKAGAPWTPSATDDGAAPDETSAHAKTARPTATLPLDAAAREADDTPTAPAKPASAPKAPPKPKAPAQPLEARLAAWFTRIGAGALLLGALYFFKYAVDSEWIGPMGRVLIGAIAGVATLVTAEVVRPRTRPAFTQVLVGIGLALLFISAYASSAFYDLVAIEVAFAANIVILLVGAMLAWRYESEAILVLVTLAGLANPVLLSTGQDRPVALFSYLLVIGGVVLAVASLKRLPITIFVTIIGTALLFGGWYAEYFQIHDLRSETFSPDVPPEQLVGAYHAIAARVAPLLFVTLATAQWLAVAVVSHKKKSLPVVVSLVATAALLIWHGGVTALLVDTTVHLGLAMIVVGVSSVLVMRYLAREKLLVLPMLFAFLLLAGGTGANRDAAPPYLLALLGVWSGVYVIAFLYDALKAGRTLSRGEAIPAVVALFAFVLLAMIATLPEGFHTAALATLASASVAGFVAYRARSGGLLLANVLVTGLALVAVGGTFVETQDRAFDVVLLFVTAVWAGLLAYLSSRLAEHTKSKLPVVTSAVAILLGLAMALVSTDETVPTMRALVTAAFGITSLGLATYHRRAEGSLTVTVFAAIAIALFAASAGFGLSGATVTLAWAVLVVVTALIFARVQEPGWLVATALLAFAVLTRILAFDVPAAEAPFHAFIDSRGAAGALSPRVFFNPRAYGLLAGGLAALASAFFVVRAKPVESAKVAESARRIAAAVLAVGGYTLLTALAISEVRGALLDLPAVPGVALDDAELNVFLDQVYAQKAALAGTLDVATTIVLALVAIALLSGGFIMKDKFHRYLGLIVFVGTIGKLAAYDVWNLPRLYQVIVLTIVGALLVAAGFLYARLKGLFAEGTAAALLLVVCLPAVARAEPKAPKVDITKFEKTAPIHSVDRNGYFAVAIPPSVYAATKADFADVRITHEGAEVPFVVQPVPADRPARWVGSRMFDPGELPDGSFRATFELDREVEHCEVDLRLSTGSGFLRQTRIETGNESDDFTTIAEGSVVYEIVSDEGVYRGTTVRYPTSVAKWVRVTLLPDPDAELTRILGASFACVTPDAIAPRLDRKLTITKTERSEDGRSTHVYLDAGEHGIPFDRLHLDIATKEFARRAQIAASAYQQVWPGVGSGVLQRVARSDRPLDDRVTVTMRPTRKRYLRLTIDDGNDAPLSIQEVRASYAAERIVFSARVAGAHALYVGADRVGPPSYDLERILAQKDTLPLELGDASIGTLVDNPVYGQPSAEPLPWTEQHRSTIAIVLVVVLLGLSAWAVRLFVSRPA